jgi:hypothetical protein
MMCQTIKDVEQSRMQHRKEVVEKVQGVKAQHAAEVAQVSFV